MFERFKKIFSVVPHDASSPVSALTRQDSQLLADWARQQGFAYADQPMQDAKGNPAGEGFVVKGRTLGKPWQMECGLPNRDFIQGQELRGRCELGVLDSVSVVLMNRPLKVALEKRAYSLYTDSLQTISPQNGKCVFFKSSELPHEVLMTNVPRLSITGWLKTN